MKIETDKNTFWLVIVVCITLFLCLCVGGGYYSYVKRTQAAFSAGLIEVPDSSQSTHYSNK